MTYLTVLSKAQITQIQMLRKLMKGCEKKWSWPNFLKGSEEQYVKPWLGQPLLGPIFKPSTYQVWSKAKLPYVILLFMSFSLSYTKFSKWPCQEQSCIKNNAVVWYMRTSTLWHNSHCQQHSRGYPNLALELFSKQIQS